MPNEPLKPVITEPVTKQLPDEPEKPKNAVKTNKKVRLLNQRQLSFCSYMVTGLSAMESYSKAYNVEPNEVCRTNASKLLSKANICNEIDRLRKTLITGSMVERVKQMGSKALDTIDRLMTEARSESVQLEAGKTVIDRLLPKTTISINQTIKVDNARLEAMKRIYMEESERVKGLKPPPAPIDAVIVNKTDV